MKNIVLSIVLMFGLLFLVGGVDEVIASAATSSVPTSSVTAPPTASADVLAQKSSGSATIVREKQGVQLQFEQSSDGVAIPGSFIGNNWDSLLFGLLAFYEMVSRLTPTEKDNTFVKILSTILNAIVPNFRKGGGIF